MFPYVAIGALPLCLSRRSWDGTVLDGQQGAQGRRRCLLAVASVVEARACLRPAVLPAETQTYGAGLPQGPHFTLSPLWGAASTRGYIPPCWGSGLPRMGLGDTIQPGRKVSGHWGRVPTRGDVVVGAGVPRPYPIVSQLLTPTLHLSTSWTPRRPRPRALCPRGAPQPLPAPCQSLLGGSLRPPCTGATASPN